MDGEHTDGLLFGGALENDDVEILNAARNLGPETQNFVELLDALVKRGGALEIELFAGMFAIRFDGDAERAAARVEKLDETADLGVVFLLGASGKARCEAHFHFRVDAAGKRGIAANFNLAAADFEKIERLFGESFRRFSGGERAVVAAGGRRAGFVDGDAARDVTARISVAQADLENCWRAETHERAVALGKDFPRVMIVRERLLERRAGQAITNGASEFAEIEALAGGIGRAEKALETAAQVLRADQERFGVGGVVLDEADGGARREGGEEVFVASGVEVLAAIEFEHGNRI